MFAKRIERKHMFLAAVISLIGAGIAIFFLTLFYPTPSLRPDYDNYFLVVAMIGASPIAIMQFMDRRWRTLAESKLPNFIRDVIEANKSGMPFLRAVEYTATLNYGVLSNEVKKMVVKMKLGDPFEDAIMEMAKRIDTPLAYRTAILLIEVGKHGGRIQEMLEEVYTHIRELQDLITDRKRQITPYMFVIYAAFGVYIFTVVVLFMTFFGQIQGLTHLIPGAPGMPKPIRTTSLNLKQFHLWFYHMGIVEATVGGLVIGKMKEGKISAGLKHVLVLLLLSFITFALVIP